LAMEMIPLERISVSTFNVRADEYFGDMNEEDQELIDNIGSHGVLQPIIVRAIGDRYELVAGRRRFLSADKSGLTEIPCIIMDVHDLEALDISLSENLFRKNLDPVTIGMTLKRRINSSGIKPGAYATKLGISKSNMSEFLRITDLSPDMQNEVQKGTVTFKEGLKVARMNLPLDKEMNLAMEAREGGSESFKNTLSRIASDHEKRGAPAGLKIIRISWGKRSKDYTSLMRLSKADNKSLSEYCQKVLTEHVQSQSG